MKNILVIICLCLFTIVNSQETEVFPLNWWTGMKNPALQLMIRSENIGNILPMYKLPASGVVIGDGIRLKALHHAPNKNYVFADLVIDKNAKPGKRTLRFTKPGQPFSFTYELKARDPGNGKSRIQGIQSKDFIYLLIPDRFANGDPSNDVASGYRDNQADRQSQFARHGGDFKGISDHFNYFRELGVTTLWLTPVVENNTNRMQEWGNAIAGYHGYWFTDHYQVDKRLGGNEGYLAFCNAAHAAGLKVIQDAVYNHVSKEHRFVLDPPMPDWINSWPEFTGPSHREETLFDPYASEYDRKRMLDGWFIDHLPDLNLQNPFLANFLVQHAIWTTANFGIDGWRVDTYKYCDEAFLNRVNSALLAEFPNITIFGEAWVNSPLGNAYFTENKVQTPFHHNANGVIDFQSCFGMQAGMSLSGDWLGGVNKLYATLAQDVLYKNPLHNCIFLDNHDMDRVFSVVDEDPARLKIGLTWLLTLRGIPQLYYGTEVLMKNKKTGLDGASVRADFPGGWAGDSINKFNRTARTATENEIFDLISRLAAFRHTSSALTTGKTTQFVPENGVYAYFRYDSLQTVMVIVNTGNNPAAPDWKRFAERAGKFSRGRDVVSRQIYTLDAIKVAPRQALVLELLP